MKIKSERGFTGIDIAISVIVLFIFVSLIAMLVYNSNSSTREAELKSEATYLAIDEIEKIKNAGFDKYDTLNSRSTVDEDGNQLRNQPTGTEGFYKTIIIEDYAELNPEDTTIIPNLVKKITVQISYRFKAENQVVELSTILSK